MNARVARLAEYQGGVPKARRATQPVCRAGPEVISLAGFAGSRKRRATLLLPRAAGPYFLRMVSLGNCRRTLFAGCFCIWRFLFQLLLYSKGFAAQGLPGRTSRKGDAVPDDASLALRLQNVELTRFAWIHNICGKAHRACGIKRVGQDWRPLSQRPREVSACEQCESAVGRPALSRNCQGSAADRDAGNRGFAGSRSR